MNSTPPKHYIVSLLALITTAPLLAIDKTWIGTGTGGQIGTPTNWSDTIAPVAGDNLFFNNTTANRRANHNSGTVNSFTSINITQTSAFSNAIEVRNRLTVTDTINLSASTGGQANIRLLSYSANAPVNFSSVSGGTLFTGSVVVGSNSNLTLSRFMGNSTGTMPTYVSGNLTVNNGGSLIIDRLYRPLTSNNTSTSLTYVVDGTVSLSAGSTLSIAPDNTAITDSISGGGDTENPDTRLQINGNFTTTGGNITSANTGAADLSINGASNSIGSGTNLNTTDIVLGALTTNQSLSSSANLNTLTLTAGGSTIKTISTGTGVTVGSINFRNNVSGGNNTLKLNSDIQLRDGSSANIGVVTVDATGTNGPITNIIDTNGFTLTGGNSSNITFSNAHSTDVANWVITGGGSLAAFNNITFNANGNGTLPSLTITAGTDITAASFNATNAGTIALGVNGLADFASISATTQTFAGALAINLGAAPVIGTYQLFGSSGGTGDFASVSITGLESVTLAGTDVWLGSSTSFNYSFSEINGQLTITAIPEPSTMAALAGLAGLAYVASRRRSRCC